MNHLATARASSASRSAAELPAGVDRELLLREAGRRWGLLERWSGLTVRERLGELGADLRRLWAEGTPAELSKHCRSLGQVPHPSSLDRIRRRAEELREAGENATLATLGRLGPRETDREPILPDEARGYLHQLWLSSRARTVMRVYRAFLAEAKRRSWPLASYPTVRRLIRAIPSDLCVLAREGEKKYLGTTAPFIQRSWDDLPAGDGWCGDHHQLDFFVRHDRTGKLLRPWLTAWLDLGSRVVIGWTICEKPNTQTILEAFAHGVRSKPRPEYSRLCGLPRFVYVDNGKDYRSATLEATTRNSLGRLNAEVEIIRGLFPELHINVVHAIAFNAKAKPVERFFGSLAMDLSPAVPGYCGHDTAHKPEALAEQIKKHERWLAGELSETPFLPLSAVPALFDAWLFGYHTRAHSELARDGRKLSPLMHWQLYGHAPAIPRDDTLELLLMHRETAKVQKNGIKLDGCWYWADALVEHLGEEVQVRRARAEAGRAYLFSSTGQRICEATAGTVLRAGASLDEVRKANEELRRRRRARKHAIDELERDAPADALTLLDSIRAEAPPLPVVPVAPAQPEPADVIRRMVPGLDGTQLRQRELEPEAPQLELAGFVPRPEPTPAPKLRLFASEALFEDEEAVAGGGR